MAASHRAALRGQPPSHAIDLDAVGVVLDTVTPVDLTRGDLLTAGALPGQLRSNEAVHLAVALRVGVDDMITYDSESAVAEAASAAVRRNATLR